MRQRFQETALERDGVRIHYDLYGQGDVTLLFPPAWAIVGDLPCPEPAVTR
ncbi:hypothetical protein [Allosalinactinospora lopnorensis]|uniref:hypothetical protein n=1 Tax=Allosalinactinospora lopnorensis TaxID=1352348 RepID=UPI0012E2EADB|nr:hypothetical protein [Allosalinactinospora lopnorensis]